MDNASAPKVQPVPPSFPAYSPGKQIGADGLQEDPKSGPEDAPVTDRDAHIVDGVSVGGGGQSPPPTLVGIAAELGRIEDKLNKGVGRPASGGACRFVDRTGEVLEVIESLQFDVDELSERPERKLGPLAVTSEAPADFNGDGTRASFAIDIPRLPATEFETLFLQRLLEFLHWQKTCRNHVAKKGTDGDPVTITWREVPYAE